MASDFFRFLSTLELPSWNESSPIQSSLIHRRDRNPLFCLLGKQVCSAGSASLLLAAGVAQAQPTSPSIPHARSQAALSLAAGTEVSTALPDLGQPAQQRAVPGKEVVGTLLAEGAATAPVVAPVAVPGDRDLLSVPTGSSPGAAPVQVAQMQGGPLPGYNFLSNNAGSPQPLPYAAPASPLVYPQVYPPQVYPSPGYAPGVYPQPLYYSSPFQAYPQPGYPQPGAAYGGAPYSGMGYPVPVYALPPGYSPYPQPGYYFYPGPAYPQPLPGAAPGYALQPGYLAQPYPQYPQPEYPQPEYPRPAIAGGQPVYGGVPVSGGQPGYPQLVYPYPSPHPNDAAQPYPQPGYPFPGAGMTTALPPLPAPPGLGRPAATRGDDSFANRSLEAEWNVEQGLFPPTAIGGRAELPPPPFFPPVPSDLAPVASELPPPAIGGPSEFTAPTLELPPSPVSPRTQVPLPVGDPAPTLRRTALGRPTSQLQAVFLTQGRDSGGRARLSGSYPMTPNLLLGASFDVASGESFTTGRTNGFSVNEAFATASLPQLPNLRLSVGQLDMTSYFDRNSFAKDSATHFFNPVFQTNPALSATGVGSRTGALVNWTATDNLELKAAAYSSSPNVGDFSLNAFAGEVGFRAGNAIVRATYASGEDSGSNDGFQEIFNVVRSDGRTGVRRGDREEAYGVNGEVFIPSLNAGVFGRYGRYENRALGQGGDTYSLGLNFLDVFRDEDRLGLAYGRSLSNDSLRRQFGGNAPNVLELFYDFRFLPNMRLGFTLQERENFSEIVAGFRLKAEFDALPAGNLSEVR